MEWQPIETAPQPEQRVCANGDCEWHGDVSETVHPKHDPSMILCPECHEVTEIEQPAQALTDRDIHAVFASIIDDGSAPSFEQFMLDEDGEYVRQFARAIEARLKGGAS